jgi:hypothetical protein
MTTRIFNIKLSAKIIIILILFWRSKESHLSYKLDKYKEAFLKLITFTDLLQYDHIEKIYITVALVS